jgi:hypothetical protein
VYNEKIYIECSSLVMILAAILFMTWADIQRSKFKLKV